MFRRLFGRGDAPKPTEPEQPPVATEEVEPAPTIVEEQRPVAQPESRGPLPGSPAAPIGQPNIALPPEERVASAPAETTIQRPSSVQASTAPAPVAPAAQGAPTPVAPAARVTPVPPATQPAPPASTSLTTSTSEGDTVTYGSVAEYDAAMRASQPTPEPRRFSGLRRFFGGQERPVEEVERAEQQTQAATEKTRSGMFGRIAEMFRNDEPITEALWDELEELMIMADVGYDTTLYLISRAIRRVEREGIRTAREARVILKDELVRLLNVKSPAPAEDTEHPYVILVVGVNGAGKTTLIAKMAHRYKDELDKSVLLAAGDTFRAAAVEQLSTWAERVGVPIIAQGQGADPGAVAFDAVQAAASRETDVLIIDTAGRLQAKYNLMQELQKIRNILRKRVATAPHEVLLVVDATTGQNGLSQARAFADVAGVTHLAITKLDGTAKGGIAFAMAHEIDRPIKYIGTGEKVGDLAIFDPQAFVDALFGP